MKVTRTHLPPTPATQHELRGWHVFIWMASFFGFMLIVNGIFLYAALTTHPGEQTKNAYLVGIDYNETLADRARQAEAGWSAAIGLAPGRPLRCIVTFFDETAQPANARDAHLVAERKGSRQAPLDMVLHRIGTGSFESDLSTLDSGQWTFTLQASIPHQGQEIPFEAEKSVRLP